MYELSFLTVEVLFAVIWTAARVVCRLRNGAGGRKREAVLLLMYVNLAVIIRFSFFSMATADGRVQPLLFDPAAVFPLRVNLIPFVNLFDYDSKRDLLLNVVGNAAMFIPSGIVLPVVYGKLDRGWKVVCAGALLSLCVEILQLPFSARASDIDDLILNTAGVAAGYAIYAPVRKLIGNRRKNQVCP